MKSKKKDIKEIDRNSKRYTFFDNKDLTHLEKIFYLEYALNDRYITSIRSKNYCYPNSFTERVEFINPINYNNFIKDITILLEDSDPITDKNISIDKNKILENIHHFNWNVLDITNYLDKLFIDTNKEHTIMSYIHIQNFTETMIDYPYERGTSIYQEHIRHLDRL